MHDTVVHKYIVYDTRVHQLIYLALCDCSVCMTEMCTRNLNYAWYSSTQIHSVWHKSTSVGLHCIVWLQCIYDRSVHQKFELCITCSTQINSLWHKSTSVVYHAQYDCSIIITGVCTRCLWRSSTSIVCVIRVFLWSIIHSTTSSTIGMCTQQYINSVWHKSIPVVCHILYH